MKHVKLYEEFTSELNEAVNTSGYIKAGKLGYNDQFLGRQSLSKTLSLDLGLSPKDEFTGPWLGFDHVSLYAIGKNGGTILDDALTGKYTYDELKTAAAEHLGISESIEENYSYESRDGLGITMCTSKKMVQWVKSIGKKKNTIEGKGYDILADKEGNVVFFADSDLAKDFVEEYGGEIAHDIETANGLKHGASSRGGAMVIFK